MKKKVLFCASTLSHLRNFHLPYLKAFGEMGYEVWAAASDVGKVPYAHTVVTLPMKKKLTSPQNLTAILAARRLIRREGFSLLSTHTALASGVARAALMGMKRRPLVVHTVHGYLFGEEDGMGRWPYLLPEMLLAPLTDVAMVMNREDERLCRKYRLARWEPVFIPGMGADLERFHVNRPPEARSRLRERWGLSPEDFLFVCAAEFSPRKNQEALLRAFAKAAPEMPGAKLILAGQGDLFQRCRALAGELSLGKRVLFPGFVEDMPGLYAACDCAVSASRREGLPFHLMEAMASSLPAAASDVKGHQELISSGKNGLLFPLDNRKGCALALRWLYTHRQEAVQMGRRGREMARQYSLDQAFPKIMEVYEEAVRRREGMGP